MNDDGLCEFTIDNMPVYVRIWDVDSQPSVRAFTVAQGRNQSEPTTLEICFSFDSALTLSIKH